MKFKRNKNQKKQKPRKENDTQKSRQYGVILGFFLLVIAVYLAWAMISYLTTGKVDQSVLENMQAQEWLNQEQLFANACGSFGAISAWWLIAKNFGLPALILPLTLALLALKLILGKEFMSWRTFGKWFVSLMIIMIWCSIAFAKYLSPTMLSEVYNPGGNHGLFWVQKIETLLGEPGLIALLLFTALLFFIYLSSETINVIRKMVHRVSSKIQFSITNAHDFAKREVEPQEATEYTFASNEEIPETDETDVEDDEDADEEYEDDAAEDDDSDVEESDDDEEEGDETEDDEDETEDDVEEDAEETVEEVIEEPKYAAVKNGLPVLSLLNDAEETPITPNMQEIEANKEQIIKILRENGIRIEEMRATIGPNATLFEVVPLEHVDMGSIARQERDIALSISRLGTRILAPLNNSGSIGVEISNAKISTFSIKSVLATESFLENESQLPIALGRNIENKPYITDLAALPHLLIGGTSGQGKSACLHAIITSLLFKKKPQELKFLLIDPLGNEMNLYNKITKPFLAVLPDTDEEHGIITRIDKVQTALQSVCQLMEERNETLRKSGCSDVQDYQSRHANDDNNMPYLVVIIDGYGALRSDYGLPIEEEISKIGRYGKKTGVHVILTTRILNQERFDDDSDYKVITQRLRNAIPARIAFNANTADDSKAILGKAGAERLRGVGNMLFAIGTKIIHLQGAEVETQETNRLCNWIAQNDDVEQFVLPRQERHIPIIVNPVTPKAPTIEPTYTQDDDEPQENNNFFEDSLFEEAAQNIVLSRQGSASMLQRRLDISFNRANRLMQLLEDAGIVGPAHGSSPREILIDNLDQLEEHIKKLKNE